MFLPLSDSPNPRSVPVATIVIVALNIGIFLLVNLPLGLQPADPADPAMAEYLELLAELVSSPAELRQASLQVSAYDLFVFKHGFRPAAPSLADLLLSMFLHGGFLHLAGNMLFLWIYGNNVEHRLGPFGFVAWYLLTGVAATTFHALFFLRSDVPLVGASGAISGVLGFYFVWFPRNTVRVLLFLPPFFWNVVEIGARIVLGLYLVIDNLLPFLFAGAGGVAHGAHIGGFIAGAAVAWVMGRTTDRRRATEVRARPAAAPAGGEPRSALRGGRFTEAASEYFDLPAAAARQALTGDEAAALATGLRRAGSPSAALALVQRAIQLAPRGADPAELHALAGMILLEDLDDPSAAYQHLVAAARLAPSAGTAAVIRSALAEIERRQRFHPGRVRR
ncbi:MAG: rhomboid family intramembrane serine protease [Thermoanaerobaculales bacterium]|jgi:membrane associated rhomboid family serine protease|nr:rhomboid family intramembrane serine protease [Thermoanaerobaculales bacterium]